MNAAAGVLVVEDESMGEPSQEVSSSETRDGPSIDIQDGQDLLVVVSWWWWIVVDTQPIGTKEVAGDDNQLTVFRSATDGFTQHILQRRLIRKPVEC